MSRAIIFFLQNSNIAITYAPQILLPYAVGAMDSFSWTDNTNYDKSPHKN